jgi:photosystem II stability/assembly factor-like uncharacterized protein
MRTLLLLSSLAFAGDLLAQSFDREHLEHNVLAQLRWRELGPVQSGGRIVDIAVHPERPQVFWAAAASGGLWRTDNGGVTFTPQFQEAARISIGDIAVAPSNGDVLYLGTGEANNQRSSYWGDGVHKSTDGGKTWRHVGLPHSEHIGRIVVHPTNPDVVYVAALGALYSSNPDRGLYKTTDGGSSWQRVLDRGPEVGVVDIAIDPKRPERLFAASYERRRRAWHFHEGGPGSRLWRSEDAGATWQEVTAGLPTGNLGRIGIDVFAGDGEVVYLSVENLNPKVATPEKDATQAEPAPANGRSRIPVAAEPSTTPGELPAELAVDLSAELLADSVAFHEWQRQQSEAQEPARRSRRNTVGGEVYRSDDGGRTFHKTHGGDRTIGGDPGYYYGQIRIDPNDRDRVYVLSVPVYSSTDGGKTWTPDAKVRRGFGDTLHVDHHALWINPRDSQHCLLGNDGGIAVTFDGGAHWDHLTHLPVLQFYTVAADDRSPYRVYGGLQDNGTWGLPISGASSGGLAATDAFRIDGGDGFYVGIDPDDPELVYSEFQFGGMSRQHLRTGERRSIRPEARKGEQPLRFNWNTPLVLSPHNGATVYVGSQFLHRSRDRGEHWQTISGDLTTNDGDKKRGNVPHCTITTIAESPLREGVLWVGTDDGRVWHSRDGGAHWQDCRDRLPAQVGQLWVSRLEASSHDVDSAFVAFTGYREDVRAAFLFRTDDGGATWRAIGGDLPAEPINVIRQHPRASAVLLVGHEAGVHVSIDDGAHWFPLGQGLPRVPVHDLIVHQREEHALIGTHGRGLWALDIHALSELATALPKDLALLPPSDGVLLPRGFNQGSVGARSWSLPNPFAAPTFRYLLAQDSDAEVELEVLDATGSVLWKKQGPKTAGYHEVVWQSERAGGRGGALAAAFSGRGNDGPRAGAFVIRLRRGKADQTQTFAVVDRRQRSGGPGSSEEEDEDR